MNFIPSDGRHPFKYYWDDNATGITADGKQYKGIVVAILDSSPWKVIDKLKDMDIDVDWVNRSRYFMRPSFKGIAYCSSEDSFDLKKGMRIAKLRALRKYYNNMANVLATINKDVKKNLYRIKDMYIENYDNYFRVYKELDQLEGGD